MPCLRLHVPTLTAGDPARDLERRLVAVRGIYGAFANCQEKIVEIDFEDDEITLTRILEMLVEAGHRGKLAG